VEWSLKELKAYSKRYSPEHCAEGELIAPLARFAKRGSRTCKAMRVKGYTVRVVGAKLVVKKFYGNFLFGAKWLMDLS
jgi:hypothetical protein